MRDVIAAMEAGDHDATLAYEMYVDRIQKHIGQYLAVLNGADAIIFTAGIGENAALVRVRMSFQVSLGLVVMWIQKKERLWRTETSQQTQRKSVSWLFNR